MTETRVKTVLLLGGNLGDGGGMNRVIRDLSTLFVERLGLETTVVALTDEAPSYPFHPAVRIEHRPEARGRLAYWRLMRELSRREVDRLIGFWNRDNVQLALACRLSGKRPILAEHTSWDHPSRRIQLLRRLSYPQAQAVVALNRVEQAYYERFVDQVVLLPNPIPQQPKPSVAKEKLVLAVGHLIDRKNFRDAIMAFQASGLAGEGWRLTIVGDGPQRAELLGLIARLGQSQFVTIEPPTSAITDWYAQA